jgi:hypothetical protein
MPFLQKLYSHSAFRRSIPLTNTSQVIHWWESRRIFFNLVVGATGVFTCLLMITCAFVSEPIVGDAIGVPDGPILAIPVIIAYGIAANFCYTLGWIVESGLRTDSVETSNKIGLRLFRVGVTFSSILTLCPALLAWAAFAYMWITGQHIAPHE